MKNERGGTGYLLSIMIIKIFIDKYDLKTFLLCMLGAVGLAIFDIVYDEFF